MHSEDLCLRTYVYNILLLALPLLAIGLTAHARPYPAEVGVCYLFNGDDVKQTAPCVISSGGGAGGTYTLLSLGNRDYSIEGSYMNNPDGEYDYTLDGIDASDYIREASFLQKIGSDVDLGSYDEPLLYCYKTRSTDICHS